MVDVDVSEPQSSSLPSTAEWSCICTSRHNVLLEGPRACTDAVLHLLKPYLGEPVTLKRSGAPLELHRSMRGALVVHDISAFSGPEQDRILGWLDDPQNRTQVVCTTTEPLFPLVTRGVFNETLYYRLNVILLHLTRSPGTTDRSLEAPHECVVEHGRASPASISQGSNP
jgi:sigma-54-interacting transcriptional regulator